MSIYRPGNSNLNPDPVGFIGTLLAPVAAVGCATLLGYLAYLGVVAAFNGVIVAANAVVAGASTASKIPFALAEAVGYALSGGEFVLLLISLQAIQGLAIGLIIGLLRTYPRLRSKLAKSLVGATFSDRILRVLSEFPGSYYVVLFTVMTNALVGYLVGILMKVFGLPPLFSEQFVGPLLVLASGGTGGGGPGSLLFWILFTFIFHRVHCCGNRRGDDYQRARSDVRGCIWRVGEGSGQNSRNLDL